MPRRSKKKTKGGVGNDGVALPILQGNPTTTSEVVVPGTGPKRIGAREPEALGLPPFGDSSFDEPTKSPNQPRHNSNKNKNNNTQSPPSTPTTPTAQYTPTWIEDWIADTQSFTPRQERAPSRDPTPQRIQDQGTKDNLDEKMSNQQGKWREEQVLVICPGSQTTMAQLGCSELTPPAHRIPTRMFKDEDGRNYRPYLTYKRKKSNATKDDEWEYVEDRDGVEGAIYPMQGGRIVNMRAFLAFIDHVHSLLTTTYHNTPIVLMASPQWTRPDCEAITRYVFEKTKTPALCLLSSAIAAQYGLKWPSMTVVDIGFEKVDVTCIYDHIPVSHKELGFPTPVREISGGEVFTQKLLSLLKDKDFTYDMAEQLKKSPICEVLPYVPEHDDLMELPTETQAVVHATATSDLPMIAEPTKPGFISDIDTENIDSKEADEGVLDVANIVTSGNTREFLAKREKEKAEKAKKKQAKGQEAEAAAAKAIRLPNSKRKTNVFYYEVLEHEDVEVPISNGVPNPHLLATANGKAPVSETPATTGDAPASGEVKSDAQAKPAEDTQASNQANDNSVAPPTEPVKTVTERRTKRVKKEIEVGLERFLFADRGEINRITDTIYRTIQDIDDIYKRSACWDNLVFVGNGSRIRGLKENIMQTLIARHLISPSTATMFTSELPSNVATPTGTGSQTPTGSFTGQLPLPTTSSVNPLLQAATTASLGVPGHTHASGSTSGEGPSHHSHGQTPMSIKLAILPTYLADWTKNGFEEAMFLGALVCARLAYCIHNLDASTTEAQRYMSLNRVDYNENGPKGIRTHCMMG